MCERLGPLMKNVYEMLNFHINASPTISQGKKKMIYFLVKFVCLFFNFFEFIIIIRSDVKQCIIFDMSNYV